MAEQRPYRLSTLSWLLALQHLLKPRFSGRATLAKGTGCRRFLEVTRWLTTVSGYEKLSAGDDSTKMLLSR